MNYELCKKSKKVITIILVFTFVFSPMFAPKAEAQWVDWANLVPNTVSGISGWGQFMKIFLDAVAYSMINIAIERMTASTVKWINSGFKGGPGFVTDPEAYFAKIGNDVAGQFILDNSPNLRFLCAPLRAKIRLALSNSYTQYDRRNWQCSATGIANNVDAFMNNFENGGWEGFFELSQGPQNPIGAYLQVENEMYAQIATQQGTTQKELDQGGGFMSYKKCKPETVRKSEPGPGGLGDCETTYNSCIRWANGNPATAEAERQKCSATLKSCSAKYTNVAVGDCADSDKETVTPGSVIQGQLDKVLGSGSNRLVAANAINQMISALLNQVINQVIGGVGRGLRGMNQPDSTKTASPTFTNQLGAGKSEDELNAYFQKNTETAEAGLDLEPPKLCTPENPTAPECNPPAGACDTQCMICRDNPSAPECISSPTP